MSLQDYEKAKSLIQMHPEKNDFVGPRSKLLIKMAEDNLKIKFPPTYKMFLEDFGAGGFGFSEIYGLISEDFENSGVPDVVWYTIHARKEWKLPINLVPVYDLGNGEIYCIEIHEFNQQVQTRESRMIVYDPGYSPEEQNAEIIASDFGKFLLDIVLMQIKE